MRILALYGFAPHTTANYMVKALKAEGHDVRTAGGTADLLAWANPYRVAGPHDYPLAQGQPLKLGEWKPELTLWIESGMVDLSLLDGLTGQTAAWMIDTHNPGKFVWHQKIAPRFDRVFCAMLPAANELPGAHWLPLACDPDIHTPRTTVKTHDIGWVGGDYRTASLYAERFRLMDALKRRYACNFAHGVYFEDMADVYGQARIGWHHSVTGSDLDMRPFEIMCSGTVLVTDHSNDSGLTDELFYRGVDVQTYGRESDLYETIDWLLAEPDHAERTGAAGRAAVLAAHTYAHRARELIEVVNA